MTPEVQLRDYQLHDVEGIRTSYRTGHRASVYVSPTGSGKTRVAAAVISGAHAKGNRTLLVAHRRELITQAAAKLIEIGITPGIICAGFATDLQRPVQVGSIQTLISRLGTMPAFDLLIFDEAHHCVSPSYSALIGSQPQAKILGLTATPARLDGKGLGVEDGGPFDDIVVGASIKELVRDGHLSPSRLFIAAKQADLKRVHTRKGDYVPDELVHALREAKIVGDAVEQYRLHADHLPTLAYCVNVEHATEVAAQFRDAGYRAACVHGGTPKRERDALIAGLASGDIEVLSSCDLISEGLDVPNVGCVILLRPTKSLVLHMQQCGRGMRPAPGKSELIILDHASNSRRHGPIEMERRWSSSGVEKKPYYGGGEGDGDSERAGQGPPPRSWSNQPGTLVEVSPGRTELIRRMPYRQFVSGLWSEPELKIYAKAHGYKPGWVWHRLQDQQALRRAS